MANSRPPMNSSKRSVKRGSASLRRASGEASIGYWVTNVGWTSVASTRCSKASTSALPRRASGSRRTELLDRRAAERRLERHRLPLVLDLGRAAHRERQLLEELLGQRHQILVGRVGLVELDGRELGVVRAVHALVAEEAANLVDAIDATDDQALEVELGGDAQEQIDVERVVVRLERPRRGAAVGRQEHARLALDVAALVEEAADARDDLRALAEHLDLLGMHDEVEVALAVEEAHVGDVGALLQHLARQRADRLGQEAQLFALERALALARLEQRAGARRRSRRARAPWRWRTRRRCPPSRRAGASRRHRRAGTGSAPCPSR